MTTAAERDSRRRPWRVHVHHVGPDYAYKTEERAVERALACLDDGYAAVSVYRTPSELADLDPLRRSVYRRRAGRTTITAEELRRGGRIWIAAIGPVYLDDLTGTS